MTIYRQKMNAQMGTIEPIRTITAIYETRTGGKFATGFTSIARAEEWRNMVDQCNPGHITEWSIDTTPYNAEEVVTVLRPTR